MGRRALIALCKQVCLKGSVDAWEAARDIQSPLLPVLARTMRNQGQPASRLTATSQAALSLRARIHRAWAMVLVDWWVGRRVKTSEQ